jgi:hypothetical protein
VLLDHKAYIRERGEDMPEISGWTWPGAGAAHGLRDTAADNA